MTQIGSLFPQSRRHAWKAGLLALLRTATTVTVLVAAYFLLPTKSSADGSDVPWLILELCLFGVVVGIQVPVIVKAQYPIIRAVESLAVIVPLYLLIFARIYLSYSLGDPTAFTRPLDNTTSLYFTVTVFATVGFGDIVADTNSMRLLVTVQMMLNLVVFGLVIRLLTSAARRGVARRGQNVDLGDIDPGRG